MDQMPQLLSKKELFLERVDVWYPLHPIFSQKPMMFAEVLDLLSVCFETRL